jgi:hypothetical protein
VMMIKKIRNTKYEIRDTNKGAALLVVLFIIMAITILSLGYLSRSDVELASGKNMELRAQMDYLTQSGLEHAKGLILNPQDLDEEYWTGDTVQQLVADSADFYDVNVVRDTTDVDDHCSYIIDCSSYRRLPDGDEIGRSSLTAELRLDPVIALWTGEDTTLWSGFKVYGDVYCNGSLINQDIIDGDAFAVGTISDSNIVGSKSEEVDVNIPVDWPHFTVNDFIAHYTAETITIGSLSSETLGSCNPVRICYRDGDLATAGNVIVNGMLIVDGDLSIQGSGNVITAAKNLPALYITGDLTIDASASLYVNGLAVVEGDTLINADSANLTVLGGLFTKRTITETNVDSSGNEIVGMLHNGPTWQSVDGHDALGFDGIDDYVQTPNDSSKLQLTNDYTLSVWIKADSVQKNWAGIFSKCNPSGSTNHWTLQFDTSNPKKIIIFHPTGSWNTGITLNELAGAWHHIAIVRNGSTMISYLDPIGVGIPRKTQVWPTVTGNGYGHFNIGADRIASPSYLYSGLIDDIRVYNRALDVNEVPSPPNGDPNLIGHWKFDEVGSTVNITAAPEKTAIWVWSEVDPDKKQKWGQAAGAFFRSIRRK